jgi:hypothetical protein
MASKNEDINIIYTSIMREKHTILSEYTECSGNFAQIMEYIKKEIINNFQNPPNIYRTNFNYGKYSIFLIKHKKLYILIMFPNTKVNNKEIIFALLYCLYEKLNSKKEINLDNISKMRAYSLKDFSLVLKEQTTKFNSNNESFISYLKYSNEFILYEPFEDRNFEVDIQLPILSNIQVHSEKKKENEEIIKEKEDNEISFRKSYNSILTQDSFKDDILNLKQEQNEKLIDDNQIDIIKKDLDDNDNDNEMVLKEKTLEFEETKKRKTKRIIFLIFIILFLVGLLIGLFFVLK